MAVKLTKEVAQQRIDTNFGENRFVFVEYKNTTEPAKIKCLKCGKIFSVKKPYKMIGISRHQSKICPKCDKAKNSLSKTEFFELMNTYNFKVRMWESANHYCKLECKFCGSVFDNWIMPYRFAENPTNEIKCKCCIK